MDMNRINEIFDAMKLFYPKCNCACQCGKFMCCGPLGHTSPIDMIHMNTHPNGFHLCEKCFQHTRQDPIITIDNIWPTQIDELSSSNTFVTEEVEVHLRVESAVAMLTVPAQRKIAYTLACRAEAELGQFNEESINGMASKIFIRGKPYSIDQAFMPYHRMDIWIQQILRTKMVNKNFLKLTNTKYVPPKRIIKEFKSQQVQEGVRYFHQHAAVGKEKRLTKELNHTQDQEMHMKV